MTVGVCRLALGRELIAFRPSCNVELHQQSGVVWCRVYRVRWVR